MSKMIRGFEYNLKENNLAEQIEVFIKYNLNIDYKKLELDSVSNPIDTKRFFDSDESTPIFHVLVTFIEKELSDIEKEDFESNEDIKYHLVIRRSKLIPEDILLKVNNKSFDFKKLFSIHNDRIYYEGGFNVIEESGLIMELKEINKMHGCRIDEVIGWLNNILSEYDFSKGCIRLYSK